MAAVPNDRLADRPEAVPAAPDLIEIVAEGVTIRVRSGVDGTVLRRVMTALRAVR